MVVVAGVVVLVVHLLDAVADVLRFGPVAVHTVSAAGVVLDVAVGVVMVIRPGGGCEGKGHDDSEEVVKSKE